MLLLFAAAAFASLVFCTWLYRIALPEGATRRDVKLAVTPESSLSVSFDAKGRRSLSKDVRLPKDAVLWDIAAKFEVDEQERGGGSKSGGISAASGAEAVSGLSVTVGRTSPQMRADSFIDIIM